MKIKPFSYGMLEIEAEGDAEKVWLSQALGMIPKRLRPLLSNFLSVDLDEGSVRDDEGNPAVEMNIEDVILDGDQSAWSLVDKISINFGGLYSGKELEKRVKTLE